MPSQVTATIDKLKGRAKQKAGEMLDADRPGQARPGRGADTGPSATTLSGAQDPGAGAMSQHLGEHTINPNG